MLLLIQDYSEEPIEYPPKEASTYMIDAVKPVLQFAEKYSETDSNEISKPLLDKVILKISQQ